jgi:spore germination protein YaaH
MVVMAYDYMWDWGSGTPVQPIQWADNIIDWSLSHFTDINRLVIGMPSYVSKNNNINC